MYIVWNCKRNEAYVTDDHGDAKYAAGLSSGPAPGKLGVSTLAEAFRECYYHDPMIDDEPQVAPLEVESMEGTD